MFTALVAAASLTMAGVGDARWAIFNEDIAVDVSPEQACPDRISFTIAFDVVPPDTGGTTFPGFIVSAEDEFGATVLEPTPVVLPANEATDTLDATEKRAFSRGFTFPWNQQLPVGRRVTVLLNDPTGAGDTPDFSLQVVPCVSDVTADIDIRPGDPENTINPNSTSRVRVAVLTTQDFPMFDATAVRRSSLRFGQAGVEAKPTRTRLKDVDGDGDKDLVARFRQSKTQIGCGDLSATLRGKLQGGDTFDGVDYIRTAGCP